MDPFLKWAGGKRWLVRKPDIDFPHYEGRYIEPFLGSGAVYFHLEPNAAILSDANSELIATYLAIRDDWQKVLVMLKQLERRHSKDYYYAERSRIRKAAYAKAAQFIYLNRTCFNGLYRVNLKGEFNVPIGTKTKVIFEGEDFEAMSNLLKNAEITCGDFELSLNQARVGDFVFVDPPYTTAHNNNGFLKYNQDIFSWEDQLRLFEAVQKASQRGATIYVTNADHESLRDLYSGHCKIVSISRFSVMSGNAKYRKKTAEGLFMFGE